MCSGIGIVMVAVVGLAICIRRGWKAALLYTAPLAAAFLLWYATYGSDAPDNAHASPIEVARFGRTLIANAFGQLGHVTGMGFVLAAVLAVGAILVIVDTPVAEFRRRYAATAALLVGALVFVAMTAWGRGAGCRWSGSKASPDRRARASRGHDGVAGNRRCGHGDQRADGDPSSWSLS